MTTHKTSAGKVVKIADMNPYHLHNAIKKLAGMPASDDAHENTQRAANLAELRHEQIRRGGPPEARPTARDERDAALEQPGGEDLRGPHRAERNARAYRVPIRGIHDLAWASLAFTSRRFTTRSATRTRRSSRPARSPPRLAAAS